MRTIRKTAILSVIALWSLGFVCDPGDDHGGNGGGSSDAAVNPAPSPDPDPSVTCSDPCDGDLLLFGPETFTRTCGSPNEFYRTVDVAEAMDVCVVATNFQVASALVKIDGAAIMEPADFNPNVTEVTYSLSLDAGQHELRVWLASTPGASVSLEIKACDPDPEPPDPTCSELATDWCEAKGWTVENTGTGSLVCVAPGFDGGDSCLGCGEYNVVVWSDGGGDPLCSVNYSTSAGMIYGGHTPCMCADNLMECGIFEMDGCIPD